MSDFPWCELGVVSNCWREQLRQGEPLDRLVEQALREGLRSIELRQGCLGDHEGSVASGKAGALWFPIAEKLAKLAANYPEARLNLALDVPFLGPSWRVDFPPLLEAGIAAASALSGERSTPHLRLVDLRTSPGDLNQWLAESRGDEIVAQIVRLAERMESLGGVLSIENSLQDWQPFHDLFQAARSALGAHRSCLKLCFDPCNLLFSNDRPNPGETSRELEAEAISMIHFKQRDQNGPTTRLGAGSVDWRSVMSALRAIGYRGPALFEIESSAEVWENLRHSRRWIECVASSVIRGIKPREPL